MFFKNKSHIKIKAGALQYVIFISIVIAIIISSFILLSYLNKQVSYKAQKFQDLVFNTNNAINYAKQKEVTIKDSLILFSFDTITKTKINSSPWGIFNKTTATSSFKNQQFKKIAFLGGNKENKSALYLQETNKPLVLVGDTEIVGKCYLPKQGVKRGNIAGNNYNGKQLIYGNTLRSRSHLPSINNREYLQNLCKGIIAIPTEAFRLNNSNSDKDVFINSFNDITKHYKSNSVINLKQIAISGNYIIQSDTLIRIYNTAKLKDVILIAPYIDIQAKTKSSFQAFARKGINIANNCELDYPTVLVLAEENKTMPNNYNQENHQIIIEPNTTIKGSICFLTDDVGNNHKIQLSIQDNAMITGEVYCEKNTALSGIVNGSIYTNAFITNAYGSIYHNHIYNGKINSQNLPKQFCGLPFKNENKNIVQWVY